jgi:hypothetical protein
MPQQTVPPQEGAMQELWETILGLIAQLLEWLLQYLQQAPPAE